jgi:UDP-N-acetylmuramate--alanine ligase
VASGPRRRRAGSDLRHRRTPEAAGSNAKLGSGEFIVVEADESDASFLYLQPVLAVVTNIDADHMETYGHDFSRLKRRRSSTSSSGCRSTARRALRRRPHVRSILPIVSKPVITYGLRRRGRPVRASMSVRSTAGCASAAARRERHAPRRSTWC